MLRTAHLEQSERLNELKQYWRDALANYRHGLENIVAFDGVVKPYVTSTLLVEISYVQGPNIRDLTAMPEVRDDLETENVGYALIIEEKKQADEASTKYLVFVQHLPDATAEPVKLELLEDGYVKRPQAVGISDYGLRVKTEEYGPTYWQYPGDETGVYEYNTVDTVSAVITTNPTTLERAIEVLTDFTNAREKRWQATQ